MDMLKLAEEIIAGRRLTRQDDLQAFLTCDLHELCQGANKIRAACVGDHVDLCSIINGRSGKCPENCKFCAQSAHNHTECQSHPMLSTEEILAAARMNENEGVHRFSIVTAGRALTGKEFDAAIEAYKTMSKECNIELCASMGFLDGGVRQHPPSVSKKQGLPATITISKPPSVTFLISVLPTPTI